MEESTKSRSSSRCREWERQRRNKFNDAISRLGDIVKSIMKAKNSSGKELQTAQFPKVEIVLRAIECLNDYIQEKTQLKADILALQIRLETEQNRKSDKIDASTQVFIGFNKKNKNSKYFKLLMQKPKNNTTKKASQKPLQKLPKLLPRSNTDNKGLENTIVVLPAAAPYIFPPRPLLVPAGPPAIFLLDNNMSLNKSSVPILNRNNGDITKTTMVNILPIPASRPLSIVKTKKNKLKLSHKKKDLDKSRSESIKNSKSEDPTLVKEKESLVGNSYKKDDLDSTKTVSDLVVNTKDKNTEIPVTDTTIKETIIHTESNIIKNSTNTLILINENMSTTIPSEDKIGLSDKSSIIITTSNGKTYAPPAVTEPSVNDDSRTGNMNEKNNMVAPGKDIIVEKDKENKLSNILDTTLCENVVDVGNARLELAEEFLAASPTAAFLMSFPLVSGNRADSPAEETHSSMHVHNKDNNHRPSPHSSVNYLDKTENENKIKTSNKISPLSNIVKQNDQKYIDTITTKQIDIKTTNTCSDNPFLNLPMSVNSTIPDTTFGLDFECNLNKPAISQSNALVSNTNIFYKSDHFGTAKSSIYSTSSISSGHDFNGIGLYACAMDKYTSKNKSDLSNVEDKIKLTYDIDLGWSHKGFDFVSCTAIATATSTTLSASYKDNILPCTSTYNPFNLEFHVPLPVSNSNKKDNISHKPVSSLPDGITSLYSQPANLWVDDVPFPSNNALKSFTTKPQNYLSLDNAQTNIMPKENNVKPYENKEIIASNNAIKSSNLGLGHQISEKFTKKSPHKTHINWMTSEIRPMHQNYNQVPSEVKQTTKSTYSQSDNVSKKHDESNYFPLTMHNYTMQTGQEEFQVWPSARPLGTTEISIEPPPINLPTLVGDLALGPHDKKKHNDITGRGTTQTEIQSCSNFLSVTQLMNRSSDNTRYQAPNIDPPKAHANKQNISHFENDSNRKSMTTTTRGESHLTNPYILNNDPKIVNAYNITNFTHKTNKSDKTSKVQKNNYSAEALLRGGSCYQKLQENSNSKFMMPSHKYNDYNSLQETGVAQVSHFPAILDYSDNNYGSQQFSGTTLYNTTTNPINKEISNTFYSNLMSGSSNLMPGNYAGGSFTGDFMDYNQTAECNYANHKYDELKMRNNAPVFPLEKMPSHYKSSRKETTAKHKLECSKKDSAKKFSKRAKVTNEVEDWNDTSHIFWQNKATSKRHANLITEEIPFPNYGNQMPSQYQPEYFNSHLVPPNMQSVGHNIDRALTGFPSTSRTNFNLSNIFPEITMKVQ